MTARVTAGVTLGLPSRSPPAQAPKRRGRAVAGSCDADARERPVELGEQVGHHLVGEEPERVQGGARLVGGLRPDDPQLVGLPHHVDELGEPSLGARSVGGRPARVLELVDGHGDAAEQVEDRAARRLGGVRGEDGPVLEAGQHVLELVTLQGAGIERLADAPHRRGERRLVDGAELLPAVQLLGDVDELEVGGERAGQDHGGRCVDTVEQGAQLDVLGLAGQRPHPLDEREQLGPLVPRQGLTEERAELSHGGSERGVLLRRRDPGGERRGVRLSAVGLEELLGRVGAALGAHGSVVPRRRFTSVSSPRWGPLIGHESPPRGQLSRPATSRCSDNPPGGALSRPGA